MRISVISTKRSAQTISKSAQISLGSAELRGSALLLRAFDQLRREVSLELTGTAGLFAGYDTLHFESPPADWVEVVVEAVVVQDLARRHEVEYQANVARRTQSDAGDPGPPIVSGRGWTLTPGRTHSVMSDSAW